MAFATSIFFLASLAMWANKLPYSQRYAAILTAPITNVKQGDFISFLRMGRQKRIWAANSSILLADSKLSDSMRTVVGQQGVDVYPWEASVIAANDLTWRNRPSPFSFQSYDPYLDNANASFLSSNQAPKFIIWHSVGSTGVQSIDGRHVLWDEPRTVRTILSHYQFVTSDDKFMLLQRRETPLASQEKSVDIGKQNISQGHIAIPDTNGVAVFANLNIKESLTYKLEDQFIRGRQYYLTIKDSQGDTSQYRFITDNANQGLLVSDLPKNWAELVQLMQNQAPSASTTELRVNGPLSKIELFSDAGL